jgi:transcriptional regulator GlxA family with amidase domain
MTELAAAAGLAQQTLSRRFTTALGVSPARHLERLLLEQVQAALSDSDEPITDIAQRLGYGSLRSLQRRFRQAYGLSPSEFRFQARLG